MENEKRNNKGFEGIEPLRAIVTTIVRESLEQGNIFQDSGIRIKGVIDMFISCRRDQLPDYLTVGPSFRLNTQTVMLERAESIKKAVPSSIQGWFELKPQQVVNLAEDLLCNQEKLYKIWFSHSGLILNSIEHSLKRE